MRGLAAVFIFTLFLFLFLLFLSHAVVFAAEDVYGARRMLKGLKGLSAHFDSDPLRVVWRSSAEGVPVGVLHTSMRTLMAHADTYMGVV